MFVVIVVIVVIVEFVKIIKNVWIVLRMEFLSGFRSVLSPHNSGLLTAFELSAFSFELDPLQSQAKTSFNPTRSALCSMPSALCSLPYAIFL
jgi:hypothetical protein